MCLLSVYNDHWLLVDMVEVQWSLATPTLTGRKTALKSGSTYYYSYHYMGLCLDQRDMDQYKTTTVSVTLLGGGTIH